MGVVISFCVIIRFVLYVFLERVLDGLDDIEGFSMLWLVHAGASVSEIESAIGMTVAHYIPWRAIRAGRP